MPCQCGPQKVIIGIEKLFLFWVPKMSIQKEWKAKLNQKVLILLCKNILKQQCGWLRHSKKYPDMLKMSLDFTLALVFCFTRNVRVNPHFKTQCSAPLKKMTYFMEGPPKLHIEMDSCRSQQCVGSSRSVQRQQCFKAVIVVGSDNRIKISFSGVEHFPILHCFACCGFCPKKCGQDATPMPTSFQLL